MLLVGLDYSENSHAALRWALAQAAARKEGLHAVHVVAAFSDLVIGTPELRRFHTRAHDVLEQSVERARQEVGSAVPVIPHIGTGAPADVLRDAAEDFGADLIVVGRRGLGTIASAMVGSVSLALARAADVPVAVVPARDGPWPPIRQLVVGVDGSDHAASALRWAAEEASLRGAELAVLHAESVPLPVGAAFGPPYPPFPDPEQATALLDEAVGKLAAHLGAPVHADRLVRVGAPGPALVEAAGPQDLLVVGRRGLGRLARLVLGSTSSYSVTHAHCPVVVVP